MGKVYVSCCLFICIGFKTYEVFCINIFLIDMQNVYNIEYVVVLVSCLEWAGCQTLIYKRTK